VRVAVVGAGISGLSTAFYLKKGGADVTVFEKSAEAGGKMKTVREDGYIIETGPNGFLDGNFIFRFALVFDKSRYDASSKKAFFQT